MAMGARKHRQRQEQLWINHTELATGPGHPFYLRLNIPEPKSQRRKWAGQAAEQKPPPYWAWCTTEARRCPRR
jgi:hypothetical protein